MGKLFHGVYVIPLRGGGGYFGTDFCLPKWWSHMLLASVFSIRPTPAGDSGNHCCGWKNREGGRRLKKGGSLAEWRAISGLGAEGGRERDNLRGLVAR